jgi:hypothetical protein
VTYPSHADWLAVIAAYLGRNRGELELWLRRRLALDPDTWRAR